MRLVLWTWLVVVPAFAMPHLDLELTGPEYQQLLAATDTVAYSDAGTDRILTAGQRLYAWIKVVNAARPAGAQISLSSPGTLLGIPITSPSTLQIDTVKVEFERLADGLPDEMQHVLLDGMAPPSTLDIADNAFVYFALKVDASYQRAARWQLLMPALEFYKKRRREDVRGYYTLTHTGDLAEKLRTFASQPDRLQLQEALLGLCRNSGLSDSACTDRFQRALTGESLNTFYATMRPYGEKIWNAFWKSQNPRSDVTWSSANPTQLKSAFLTPSSAKVADFLRINIEDEWRWQDWTLKLDFRASGFNLPHIEFQTGATPHVNSIGGAVITMDANTPLEEYAVRWTIRHEFGHVLGLPDCYVEFFDESQNAFINYQLDTSDLMCSRAGKMNQRIYDELRQAYFR